MSKLAILLFLFGTTAVVWQQAEAKPFFFLPANFFVLTTRAPSTDSTLSSTSTSYSSPSTSFGGLFQLPINIIRRKLNFINSLLSSFSGGAEGGGNIGAGGIVGGGGKFSGSFGLGFKFNAGPTPQRPRTTTEGSTETNTIFTPQYTTNAPKSSTGDTVSYGRDSTTTTSTERSLVSTTTAALSSTTAKSVAQVPYISTTEGSAPYISSTSKPFIDTTVSAVTSVKPTLVTEQPVNTITTEKSTTNLATSTESFITMETFNTVKATITPTTEIYSPDVDSTSEDILSTTTTTEEHPSDVDSTSENILSTTTTTEEHPSDVDSTSEDILSTTTEEQPSDVDSTSETTLTTTTTTEKHSYVVDSTSEVILSTTYVASITVRPTVVAQTAAIIATTESVSEVVASTTEGNGSLNTNGYVYHTGKPEAEIVTESVTNTGYNYRRNEETNGVSGSGYAYKKPSSERDNENFSGDMYLPVL